MNHRPATDYVSTPLATAYVRSIAAMHQRGIIDKSAVREAPSIAARPDQPITISRQDHLRYHKPVGNYAVSLIRRITTSKYNKPTA